MRKSKTAETLFGRLKEQCRIKQHKTIDKAGGHAYNYTINCTEKECMLQNFFYKRAGAGESRQGSAVCCRF